MKKKKMERDKMEKNNLCYIKIKKRNQINNINKNKSTETYT